MPSTVDPQTDLPTLAEDLEVNIDELTIALAPLLDAPFAKTASSLPLLDKSKLYVLAAYSIESLLFSTLQSSGIDAKDHAIFPELARLKGYFTKIKEVEDRGTRPTTKLDVGAAQRFIKHGLVGNERYDLDRREKQAKDRARAAIKARRINKKFDDETQTVVPTCDATSKKRDADEAVDVAETRHDEEANSSPQHSTAEQHHASKKSRIAIATTTLPTDTDSPNLPSAHSSKLHDHQSRNTSTAYPKKRKSRSRKSALHDSPTPLVSSTQEQPTQLETARKPRRYNPRAFDDTKAEEVVVPQTQAQAYDAQKTRSVMFNRLLNKEAEREADSVSASMGADGLKGKGKDKGKGRK